MEPCQLQHTNVKLGVTSESESWIGGRGGISSQGPWDTTEYWQNSPVSVPLEYSNLWSIDPRIAIKTKVVSCSVVTLPTSQCGGVMDHFFREEGRERLGGALSAVRAQCNYLGAWLY